MQLPPCTSHLGRGVGQISMTAVVTRQAHKRGQALRQRILSNPWGKHWPFTHKWRNKGSLRLTYWLQITIKSLGLSDFQVHSLYPTPHRTTDNWIKGNYEEAQFPQRGISCPSFINAFILSLMPIIHTFIHSLSKLMYTGPTTCHSLLILRTHYSLKQHTRSSSSSNSRFLFHLHRTCPEAEIIPKVRQSIKQEIRSICDVSPAPHPRSVCITFLELV